MSKSSIAWVFGETRKRVRGPLTRIWIIRLSPFLLGGGTLLAQNIHPQRDVELGRQLFVANCAICHGPDGDRVPQVDLGHGKFRRATSDEDLVRTIKDGIRETAMPGFSNDFLDTEIGTIVAYLRYMASTARSVSAPGDAARGRVIFEGKSGGCFDCHRVKDKGSRVGPDLTDIGAVRRSVELERSVVEPDAEILPSNRFIRVVTEDGLTVTGRLLNQDTFTVQLIDSKERLLSFQRSRLREYAFVEESPMPSYRDKLNRQQLADLVSYLVSLKGIDGQ